MSVEHGTPKELARVTGQLLSASDKAASVIATHMLDFPLLAADEKLTPALKEARSLFLDNAAEEALRADFSTLDFEVDVVGCEGAKESQAEKGGLVINLLHGKHGNPMGPKYDMVIDPVEGTTAACSRRSGAVVIMAICEKGGIVPTPEGVHYMYKLMAPASARGVLDISRVAQYNVGAMADLYGAGGVRLVVMDRAANADIITAAEQVGIEVARISAGDLLPSLAAVTGQRIRGKHVVVYGRGGDEEGRIAAVAAKACDGFAQGQVWIAGEDPNVSLPNLPLFDRDQIVSGRPENTSVLFTPITNENTWFGLDGYDDGSGVLRRPTSVAIVHRDQAARLSAQLQRDRTRQVLVLSS